MKETIAKINKTKSWFLKKITKLTNSKTTTTTTTTTKGEDSNQQNQE